MLLEKFIISVSFTFSVFLGRATHELHSAEYIDATGEEHGKWLQLHATVWAGCSSSGVPLVKVPALGLVVNVIKEAMLGDQQSVRLERSLWK